MLSAGMFSALAAAIAVRRRGLPSASPPPDLAAIVISLIRRVKILPRLASSAPFLCLIVAHFEWPDIRTSGVVSDEFFGEMRENNTALEQLPQLESIAVCRGRRETRASPAESLHSSVASGSSESYL